MFSPVSSLTKKGFFARKTLPFFFALCLVMGMAVFSGCDLDGDDTGNLAGTWTNVAGSYVTTITITNNTVVYSGSYEATIENAPDFEATNGVLILKFTKYVDWSTDEAILKDDHSNVGKYGAMYWKELTASSVSLADAYTGTTHVLVDDWSTAQTTFTNDAVDTYINWSITSPYTK
ncbi:MAG: hypothetical protein LBP76_10925 [Treponema sp.]|jgi:hypothetical protein|nr:hypothetical protein [Treponema sp.]